MGDAVGDTVGLKVVGDCVGETVVGAAVSPTPSGDAVGLVVGETDGEFVGDVVGAAVVHESTSIRKKYCATPDTYGSLDAI